MSETEAEARADAKAKIKQEHWSMRRQKGGSISGTGWCGAAGLGTAELYICAHTTEKGSGGKGYGQDSN